MKGAQIPIYIVIVMVLLSVAVLALAAEFGANLDKSARVETVPLVEKRLESAIYTMSGIEEGETTIKLGDEYGLKERDSDILINYSAKLTVKDVQEGERILDPPVEFSLIDEGVSNRFCISKSESGISLAPEAC